MITVTLAHFSGSVLWIVLTIALYFVSCVFIIAYPNYKNPTPNTTLRLRERIPDSRENHQTQERRQVILQNSVIPSNQMSHHLASDYGLSGQTDPVALRDEVLESSNR